MASTYDEVANILLPLAERLSADTEEMTE